MRSALARVLLDSIDPDDLGLMSRLSTKKQKIAGMLQLEMSRETSLAGGAFRSFDKRTGTR